MTSSPQSAPSPRRTLSARQLHLASLLVGSSFILSGALGVVRGAIINSTFGAGEALDAFLAAFRVPETLFMLVGGGALGAAFIPVYSRLLTANDERRALHLATVVLATVTLAAAILALVAAVFAPSLVATFLSRESAPDQQALIVALMRPMLLTVVIFAVSGLVMGMLNANQRFLAPALAPSFYNLGLIIGAVFLTPAMGIFGLAWGAVIGALLHLGVQLPTLREIGFQWRASLAWPASWPTSWAASGAGEVFRLMAPRILGQGVTQINFWVNTTLSSGMGEGSLTALVTAFTLMFTVLGVLGQSVGTAVFPTLAMLYAQHDTEGFRRTLANALRSVLFTTIPASLGLIVLAAPLIATIYERGAWTSAATVSSAWALGFFALGLAAFGLQEILARSFYAIKDTTTPVVIAVLGVILNVVLSLALIRVVQGADPAQGAFGGLALANALATLIESIALWFLLRRRVGSLHDAEIMAMVGRVVVAALVMGAAVYSLDRALAGLPMVPMVMRLVAGALVGGAIYAGIGLLVGLPEARSVPAALLRRFRR